MKPVAHLRVNGRKRSIRCEVEANGDVVFTVPESWTKKADVRIEVVAVVGPGTLVRLPRPGAGPAWAAKPGPR